MFSASRIDCCQHYPKDKREFTIAEIGRFSQIDQESLRRVGKLFSMEFLAIQTDSFVTMETIGEGTFSITDLDDSNSDSLMKRKGHNS